jgi:hypothetical protein
MGLIGCPETSVGIYRSTMRKIPKERRYQANTSTVSQEIPRVLWNTEFITVIRTGRQLCLS